MAFIMNSVEEEPSRGPPPRPVIASSAMKNVNSFDDWIKICLELDSPLSMTLNQACCHCRGQDHRQYDQSSKGRIYVAERKMISI